MHAPGAINNREAAIPALDFCSGFSFRLVSSVSSVACIPRHQRGAWDDHGVRGRYASPLVCLAAFMLCPRPDRLVWLAG